MNTKLTTALGLTLVSALTMGIILKVPNTEAFQDMIGKGSFKFQEQVHKGARNHSMMMDEEIGQVNRKVNLLSNGVEIFITSDDPNTIERIQSINPNEHQHHNDEISHIKENISNGVKMIISSENKDLVEMIQEHAENISKGRMRRMGRKMMEGRSENDEDEGSRKMRHQQNQE